MAETKGKTSRAIGIDLGTTFSCVAVYKDGRPEIIVNAEGQRTTPSVVGFDEDWKRYVGTIAEYIIEQDPKRGIFGSKRAIGRGFDDRELQKAIKNFPFEMVRWDRNNNCETNTVAISETDNVKVKIKSADGSVKYYEPAEISAMILSYLKESAENVLGHKVEKGVITVPAYFNDNQRSKTRVAAQIAGFKDIRLVNEPKAAAMAYGHNIFSSDSTKGKAQTIMVFDLGGGTFDVTIMKFEDPTSEGSIAEVLATDGDTFTGGMDFDDAIFEYAMKDFFNKNPSVKPEDISPNAKRRLRIACENAKRLLSSMNEATISVNFFHEKINLLVKISRPRFNDLCKKLFDKCIDKVKGCIMEYAKVSADYDDDGFLRNEDSNLIYEYKSKIDRVLMIGGSSRIPRIRERLVEFFGASKIDDSINPDEAVALGAAFQAALLADDADLDPSKSILLLDSTPLNISIETAGGIAHTMIAKGTTYPIKKTETFTTYSDNQPSVTIRIFEGVRPRVEHNRLIGNFNLDGIQPAPRGVPQIEITCSIDHDGILKIDAVDKATNKAESLTVTNFKATMTEEEIQKMVEEEEKYRETDRLFKEKMEAKQMFENGLYASKSAVEKSQMSDADKQNILNKIKEHEDWLNSNPDADKEEYERRTKEIQELFGAGMQQPPSA